MSITTIVGGRILETSSDFNIYAKKKNRVQFGTAITETGDEKGVNLFTTLVWPQTAPFYMKARTLFHCRTLFNKALA